jgi:hypothetical protein
VRRIYAGRGVNSNYEKAILMKEIQRRVLILAIVLTAIVVSATAGYVYIASISPAKPKMTVIRIPKGADSTEPVGFNFTFLTSPKFQYPVNVTVVIGVNNTVQWVNDDSVAHTVSAFIAPQGAAVFNSGLIQPGKTFSASLAVPGVYKYTCLWHQWLAGQITVKSV